MVWEVEVAGVECAGGWPILAKQGWDWSSGVKPQGLRPPGTLEKQFRRHVKAVAQTLDVVLVQLPLAAQDF